MEMKRIVVLLSLIFAYTCVFSITSKLPSFVISTLSITSFSSADKILALLYFVLLNERPKPKGKGMMLAGDTDKELAQDLLIRLKKKHVI